MKTLIGIVLALGMLAMMLPATQHTTGPGSTSAWTNARNNIVWSDTCVGGDTANVILNMAQYSPIYTGRLWVRTYVNVLGAVYPADSAIIKVELTTGDVQEDSTYNVSAGTINYGSYLTVFSDTVLWGGNTGKWNVTQLQTELYESPGYEATGLQHAGYLKIRSLRITSDSDTIMYGWEISVR